MRIQVTLTPAESKKLISKAVAKMDLVVRALKDGLIVIHPSTTTMFLVEEITGIKPTGRFVYGMVVPKGTCVDRSIIDGLPEKLQKPGELNPWVINRGKLMCDMKLDDLLSEMKPGDVYIKAGNALDYEGNVGVFVASPAGGTIGRAFAVCMAKGIDIILPIGLEKLIPISVREAAKEAGIERMNYSMGIPVGVFPVTGGIVITELEAIKILTGSIAVPIGSGGIGGAEGSVTLIIKGNDQEVRNTLTVIEAIKGTKLPEIASGDCITCTYSRCSLRGNKH